MLKFTETTLENPKKEKNIGTFNVKPKYATALNVTIKNKTVLIISTI